MVDAAPTQINLNTNPDAVRFKSLVFGSEAESLNTERQLTNLTAVIQLLESLKTSGFNQITISPPLGIEYFNAKNSSLNRTLLSETKQYSVEAQVRDLGNPSNQDAEFYLSDIIRILHLIAQWVPLLYPKNSQPKFLELPELSVLKTFINAPYDPQNTEKHILEKRRELEDVVEILLEGIEKYLSIKSDEPVGSNVLAPLVAELKIDLPHFLAAWDREFLRLKGVKELVEKLHSTPSTADQTTLLAVSPTVTVFETKQLIDSYIETLREFIDKNVLVKDQDNRPISEVLTSVEVLSIKGSDFYFNTFNSGDVLTDVAGDLLIKSQADDLKVEAFLKFFDQDEVIKKLRGEVKLKAESEAAAGEAETEDGGGDEDQQDTPTQLLNTDQIKALYAELFAKKILSDWSEWEKLQEVIQLRQFAENSPWEKYRFLLNTTATANFDVLVAGVVVDTLDRTSAFQNLFNESLTALEVGIDAETQLYVVDETLRENLKKRIDDQASNFETAHWTDFNAALDQLLSELQVRFDKQQAAALEETKPEEPAPPTTPTASVPPTPGAAPTPGAGQPESLTPEQVEARAQDALAARGNLDASADLAVQVFIQDILRSEFNASEEDIARFLSSTDPQTAAFKLTLRNSFLKNLTPAQRQQLLNSAGRVEYFRSLLTAPQLRLIVNAQVSNFYPTYRQAAGLQNQDAAALTQARTNLQFVLRDVKTGGLIGTSISASIEDFAASISTVEDFQSFIFNLSAEQAKAYFGVELNPQQLAQFKQSLFAYVVALRINQGYATLLPNQPSPDQLVSVRQKVSRTQYGRLVSYLNKPYSVVVEVEVQEDPAEAATHRRFVEDLWKELSIKQRQEYMSQFAPQELVTSLTAPPPGFAPGQLFQLNEQPQPVWQQRLSKATGGLLGRRSAKEKAVNAIEKTAVKFAASTAANYFLPGSGAVAGEAAARLYEFFKSKEGQALGAGLLAGLVGLMTSGLRYMFMNWGGLIGGTIGGALGSTLLAWVPGGPVAGGFIGANIGGRAGYELYNLGDSLFGGSAGGNAAPSLTGLSNQAGAAKTAMDIGTLSTGITVTGASAMAIGSAIYTQMAFQHPLDITPQAGESSKYVSITKVANPDSLENNEQAEVTYTITITPKDGYVITPNLEATTDEISYLGGTALNLDPESSRLEAIRSQLGSEPFSSEKKISYSIPMSGEDVLVSNMFSLAFSVGDGDQTTTDTLNTDASVQIGNPSVGCFIFGEAGKQFKYDGGMSSPTKAWTEADKSRVLRAFGKAAKSPKFYNLACGKGDITLYRLPGRPYGGWTLSPNSLALYDLGMSTESAAEYTLIHELGHIIDHRNPGLRSSFNGAWGGRMMTYGYPAGCSSCEAFAESIALYIIYPYYNFSKLGGLYNFPTKNPDEYEWVRKNIYGL